MGDGRVRTRSRALPDEARALLDRGVRRVGVRDGTTRNALVRAQGKATTDMGAIEQAIIEGSQEGSKAFRISAVI